jgi:hypothetical protein
MFARLVTLAAVSAMLVASACGGSGGGTSQSSAETWADGVCSSLATWKSSVTDAGNSITNGSGVDEDQVRTAVDQVKDATTKLSSDLKSLGRPDTEGGQQAQAALTKLSGQLDEDVQQVTQAVEGASGPAAAVGIATSVGASLTQAQTQVSAAFSTIENADAKGELSDAFQSSDACKQFTGSGS